MVRLAEYSRDQLIELRAATGIAYDGRQQGTLQLFREQKQLDHAHSDIEVLKQYGVPYEVLDPAGCVAAEPGLRTARVKFVGGLRLPNDETGDCRMFTERLATICAAPGVGVPLRHDHRGHRDRRATRHAASRTSRGLMTADAYVLALGSYSPLLARPLGIGVPVYPIKGYSLTVPITNADGGAGLDGHGRNLQGRNHAAWRPHPRRRHR